MAKKTAKQFSRKKIWEMATKYANTEGAYARDYFSREYRMSYGTFYSSLERAVVQGIVDEETVQRMAKKAENNAVAKAGERARKRPKEHYEYLLLKRKVYMFPKEEAVKYTAKYAESPLNKKEFCKNNFIDVTLFDRTLYKAILENWVSDEVVAKLKAKSLKKDNSEKVNAFWEQLLSFRNENKKNQG